MKKTFIPSILLSTGIMIFGAINAEAVYDDEYDENYTEITKEAIEKYKNRNFLGCISDLRIVTQKDGTNTVAWYYLGNAYMKIGMLNDAYEAFDNVIDLNKIPQLTSYALQAQMCMQNNKQCEYQNFTMDEIKKLRMDPVGFFTEYNEKKAKASRDTNTIEIERLINGEYGNTIHPVARNFIEEERTKIKQSEINESNEEQKNVFKKKKNENE